MKMSSITTKMQKINFKKINTIVLIAFAALTMNGTNALAGGNKNTETGYLEISGKIKIAGNGMSDARITVMKDSAVARHCKPDAKGRFDIKLEMNCVYYLQISARGMTTKSVMISTVVPNEALAAFEYEYPFNIELNPYTGENISSDVPVAKLAYQEKYDGFDYDRFYNRDSEISTKTTLAVKQ